MSYWKREDFEALLVGNARGGLTSIKVSGGDSVATQIDTDCEIFAKKS